MFKNKKIKNSLKTNSSKLVARRGFVLPYSVLISGILLSIGLAIFSVTIKELILSSGGRESQLAFYAADTGAECALYWDLKHPTYSGSVFAPVNNVIQSPAVANGLTGYWAFNESSGLSAYGSAGSGYNGWLSGMSSSDWVVGKHGNALDFDGNNDYVGINHNALVDNLGTISVALWVKVGTYDTWDRIVSKEDGSSEGYSIQLGSDAQKVRFNVDNTDGLAFTAEGGNVNDGAWHHVVGTFDENDKTKLYVDGTFVSESASFYGAPSTNSNVFAIGRKSTGGGYFEGVIDDVRVYDNVLSVTDVADLYNQSESSSVTIALICGDSICSNTNKDVLLRNYLTNTLGHTVSIFDDSDSSWDPTAYSAVVISESIDSWKSSWLKDEPVGILTLEGNTEDEFELANDASSGNTPDDDIKITNSSHYITQQYDTDEVVRVIDTQSNIGRMAGWANDVMALGLYSSSPSSAWLLAVEKGGVLEGGSNTAADRRVFLGSRYFANLSTKGIGILARALDWVAYNETFNIGTVYTQPLPQNSNISCSGQDISDPTTGWDNTAGWDLSVNGTATTTVFDMSFNNGSCASVTVIKDIASTRIDSRGYNTCDSNSERRVERGLRVRY